MQHKTFIYTKIIIVLTLLLSGCSSDVPRMQKFDAQASYKPETAVIIVNTSNVTFVDINKYHADSFNSDREFYTKGLNAGNAHQAVTNDPLPNANMPAVDSRAYQDGFDLRRLFSKKTEPAATNTTVAATTVKAATVENTAPVAPPNNWRLFKPTLSLLSPFNYSKAIYTVEPGIYYIAFAYYDGSSVPTFTADPGVTKEGVVNYGAFEVKAGSVVYLGDIDFNWITMNPDKKVMIINNINSVRKDLNRTGFSHLATKLEMAKFYPRGTILNIH